MDKHLQALELITGILTQANAAVPIVFGVISAISAIVKGVTGTGPSAGELADLIEAKIDANDQFKQTEVARLRAILGVSVSMPVDPATYPVDPVN